MIQTMFTVLPTWAYILAALLASFGVFLSAAIRAADATELGIDE